MSHSSQEFAKPAFPCPSEPRMTIVGNNADPEWDQKLEFGCVTHDAPIVFNVRHRIAVLHMVMGDGSALRCGACMYHAARSLCRG
eukprot:12132-Eustigmatos_ZCMA.PRE.1